MPRHFKHQSVDDVKWSEGVTVSGIVKEKGSIKVGKDQRKFLVVDTGSIIARVYHAAGLDEAFVVAEPGDNISIQYLGQKDLAGGKRFNRFSVQVWTETGTTDEPEV